MDADLIPMTFFSFAPLSDGLSIAERYATRWGGQNVTAEPTDVKGEFRITGLFPREFAEARSYEK